MINTILTILASFIGIVAGIALARISPEELEPGHPYFQKMKLLLFGLIIITSLIIFSIQVNLIILSIILCYTIIRYKKKLNLTLDYIIFAVILASITNPNHLYITSSLIFLYGLPTGTLLLRK